MLRLSATAIKEFFQYRCERQLRYHMMDSQLRRSLRVDEREKKPVWAGEGNEYEELVIAKLAARQAVLRPGVDAEFAKLTETQTLDFLHRRSAQPFAHQLRLHVPIGEAFSAATSLAEDVLLSEGFTDLVEAVANETDEVIAFRVIDIKAVQHTTLSHRIQVAYYSLLLEAMLRRECINIPIHPKAQIWHATPTEAGVVNWRVSEFLLKGYQQQVLDFLRRTVPRIAAVVVGPSRDDTEFHIYYKCEQCNFLPHCIKSIAPQLPPARLDLSAVPGMSAQAKRTLRSLGVTDVGSLAAANEIHNDPRANWSLYSQGETLCARAKAIVRNTTYLLPRRYTHGMPDRIDLAIHLVVDKDPMEGRLAALGCLMESAGQQQFLIRPVREPGPQAERDALASVLTAVVNALDQTDAHNAANLGNPIIAHLFIYEPSEAADLAAALGMHLNDNAICTALLHMLRMFPPEDFVPEPEYHGVPHLPATSLRSIVETLLATPVRVSHNLGGVTRALADTASPALSCAYRPETACQRPFSSRLNIDACHDLKTGTLSSEIVEADVRARLLAMSALVRWLIDRNAEASDKFLRLKKPPFRWQQKFEPLNAADLQVLLAHELLDAKTKELAALAALAMPWEMRRDRLRCFARLRLMEWDESPARFGDLRLRFLAPPKSWQAEIEPGAIGLILTDDHPDRRLDPNCWPQVFAQLVDLRRRPDAVELVVDVGDGSDTYTPMWTRLISRTAEDGWFLDQAYRDLNGSRMEDFLNYLSATG